MLEQLVQLCSVRDLVTQVLGPQGFLFAEALKFLEFSLAEQFLPFGSQFMTKDPVIDNLWIFDKHFKLCPIVSEFVKKWLSQHSSLCRFINIQYPELIEYVKDDDRGPSFAPIFEKISTQLFPKVIAQIIKEYICSIDCVFCYQLLFKSEKYRDFELIYEMKEIAYIAQTCGNPKLKCRKCGISLYHHQCEKVRAWYYYPQYGYGCTNSQYSTFNTECLDDCPRQNIYCPRLNDNRINVDETTFPLLKISEWSSISNLVSRCKDHGILGYYFIT